jgi:hypothetical protein
MGAKPRRREAAAAEALFRTRFESSAAKATKNPQVKEEKARNIGRAFRMRLQFDRAYAVGRRAMIFFAAAIGSKVAILRIMASTRRLSPSESVLLYF